MIIQTGMRTDIPAFYSEWLMNRIQEGFVLVRNPYNPTQVTKYSLSPEVVDLIAFCTKNPAPMLPFMEQLTPYGQYWFVTITPYGRDIEPNVPDTGTVMDHFKILSDIVGVDSIGWRYDPILVDATHTVEWHISEFEKMAAVLHGYTETCVISFIDIYKKVERNFPEAKAVSRRDRITIGKALIEIAAKYGMTVRPCAEGNDLAAYGADCSGCMTVATFEKALHNRLEIPKRKINQRNGACACVLGVDIGAYDTCGHLCKYCYDFEGHYIEARHEKKCNYMAMDKDILYLQYWQDEEQNMPYVNYNGIMANAWIKEDKFAGKVNTMKEDKKGVCKVGERTFYANSNGCFSTEKEYSNIPAMSAYIWDEMKTEKQKNANYQKVLEKKIGYDSDFLYGFNEYQKGKYIYGVVNIWEEDVRLRNMEIPINNVVKSYVYKVNLLTNDVEILFQRDKGCVQIASNEKNAICYEKNMIKRINLKTEKSDILYNGLRNKTENIYLQGPYLLVAGENKYIQYDATY